MPPKGHKSSILAWFALVVGEPPRRNASGHVCIPLRRDSLDASGELLFSWVGGHRERWFTVQLRGASSVALECIVVVRRLSWLSLGAAMYNIHHPVVKGGQEVLYKHIQAGHASPAPPFRNLPKWKLSSWDA